MKNYLRNEIIIKKGTYINQVFKILKGHVSDSRSINIYKPNDYLFLESIFQNTYTTDDYLALDLVTGVWLDKKDLDIDTYKILGKMYIEKRNHAELLLITDDLTKIARYLYFEMQNNQAPSFYLTFPLNELASYLKINIKTLSEYLKYLSNSKIISKHNKLFNILDSYKLEKLAYKKDN